MEMGGEIFKNFQLAVLRNMVHRSHILCICSNLKLADENYSCIHLEN